MLHFVLPITASDKIGNVMKKHEKVIQKLKRNLRNQKKRKKTKTNLQQDNNIDDFLSDPELIETRKRNMPATQLEEHLFTRNYEISKEPVFHDFYSMVAEEDKEEERHAYEERKKNPLKSKKVYSRLSKKYPHNPLFRNNLLSIRKALNESLDYETELRNLLRDFPDYLFAKTNYAKWLLLHERASEIPLLFEHKYNLKEVYPDRDIFHISEHLSFYCCWGNYFLAHDRFDCATRCYEMIPSEFQYEDEVFRLFADIRNHPLILDVLKNALNNRDTQ